MRGGGGSRESQAPNLSPPKLKDWYGVSRRHVIKQPGGISLFYHHATLEDMLKELYPEFPWDLSKFAEPTRFPNGFWSDSRRRKAFVEHLARKLSIKKVTL